MSELYFSDIAFMIEVKNLVKTFADKVILSDISFSIPHEQNVAIVGKSGAAKTTIIDLLFRFF